MHLKKIFDQLEDKEIILDFDGVITQLNVDWNKLKQDLKHFIGLSQDLDMGRLYLYFKINDKYQQYLKIVKHAETKGVNYNTISPLFKSVIKNNFKFNICSSNTRQTIMNFLNYYKCQNKAKKIVSIEDICFMKPNPEGLLNIIGNTPDKFIFIGNSLDDRISSKLAKVRFVEYEF